MKRIAIIGTAGVPARYGGFETLAEQLVNTLSNQYSFIVYCTKSLYTKEERSKSNNENFKHLYLPLQANGKSSILYDFVSMLHAIFYADILLVLGVSGAILFPVLRLFTNKKLIVNIDGIEWRRDKWKGIAKWYLKLSERVAVNYAHTCIADNKAIQDYVFETYHKNAILAEYGADHTMQQQFSAELKRKYPFIYLPYAFVVCRIEPENNTHLILEAFSKDPTKQLVIVGNWENSLYGKALLDKYSQTLNIHLLGPIYEQVTLNMLRSNCFVYIHGHSAGGTNPSLIEAMYLGLPILAFDVSYNRESTENKAHYFENVQTLTTQLKTLRLNDLMENGKNMKEIADRRYRWEIIAAKYNDMFTTAIKKKREKKSLVMQNQIG
ncbi:MAG: DUF1972 domain-containing protein [Chitinophagales bacterium]